MCCGYIIFLSAVNVNSSLISVIVVGTWQDLNALKSITAIKQTNKKHQTTRRNN